MFKKEEYKGVHERFKKCMQMKQILEDGKWWFDICIGNKSERKGELDNNENKKNLQELRKIYNNHWYKKFRSDNRGQLGPCPVIMIGGAQSPLFYINRFAQNLRTLRIANDLESEIVKRLQQFDTFLDASIEVEIGACFVESGYKVDLHPILSNGRKCDMRIRGENGDWIYVEITHLKLSEQEKRVFKLSSQFMKGIKKTFPEEISGFLRFIKPLSLQQNELLGMIIQRIKQEYVRNGLPIVFKDDIVKVELRKKEKGKGLRIEGLSMFTQRDEGRHLIERALRKYKQLPKEGPGIIIVNPTWILASQIRGKMDERLKGLLNPYTHKRVSGIIITNKRAERSGIMKTIPLIVINSYAKRRCDNDIIRLAQSL